MPCLRPLVIAAALVGGLAACGDSTSTSQPASSGASSSAASSSAAASSAPASGNAVTIANFMFAPGNLAVTKGTVVTWTNQDPADHTVTATSGPELFDSRPDKTSPPKGFGQGKTFTFTFNQPGTYAYHCEIHQFITGTVTVSG